MNLGSLLLTGASLLGGAYLYTKYFKKGEDGEPLKPISEDDTVIDEGVTALESFRSARWQIWQNVYEGFFYGRWAIFAEDGETVLRHGGTPRSPGIDAVAADLEKAVAETEEALKRVG